MQEEVNPYESPSISASVREIVENGDEGQAAAYQTAIAWGLVTITTLVIAFSL